MWRGYLIALLVGFLLVSVGGNAVLFQQAAANRVEAEQYRQRLQTVGAERSQMETRVNELNAENQQLREQQAQTAAALAQAQAQRGQQGAPAPVAPVPTVGSTTAPRAAGPDRSILQRIEAQVSSIRGLVKKNDVPLRFLNRTELRQYFVRNFDQDYLPHERESDQKLLVALGFVRPSENLVQILLDLLQEQVIGTYNDDEKVMYLIGDQVQFGPEEKLTFAHEFQHALQDQHYDLAKIAPKHPENNDRSLAIHALVEGDAVLLQRFWMQEALTPDEVNQLAQGGSDSKLDQAPLIVRAELLFPYTDGFVFATRAFQAGGGWKGIDDAFKDLPESTEQILHFEKYRSREKPIEVAVPDLAAQLGDGWRRINSNILGEFDTRVLLEQYGDRASATRAAAGWGGDRWYLMEKDGKTALVWKSAWDTENDAREFFDTYGLGLRNRFSDGRVEANDATRQAITASTWATELRRNGTEVLAVLAFDRATAEQLVGAVGGF